jgi:ABC-type molybdate transport system substrate-binding protein
VAVFKVGLALFLLAQATSTSAAAEISFFCTDALAPSMRELVPEFEKASGHHVKTTVANAGTIAARFKQLRRRRLIPGGEFRATLGS